MNGLEAIELMQEGKVVIYHALDGTFLNKINDGIVLVKGIGEPSDAWRMEVSFNFGGLYGEYVPIVTGWERVNIGDKFRYISTNDCRLDDEVNHSEDNLKYRNANYFSTKEKAKEINFKQTLFRRMQRFSDENGGSEIDWTHEGRRQYFISFDYDKGKFVIDSHLTFRDFGQVYFVSLDVARKALEMFKGDLIKYFTHDWSKGE